MKVIETALPGVLIIEPKVFGDHRGFFLETFQVDRYREIGITLPNGTVGPGRYLATGSVEWQQPLRRCGLPTGWESTLFVDAGQVAERADGLGRDLRVGVGAGARWRSPIGPLQIDLAYGLQVEKLRLHLSVGWVF